MSRASDRLAERLAEHLGDIESRRLFALVPPGFPPLAKRLNMCVLDILPQKERSSGMHARMRWKNKSYPVHVPPRNTRDQPAFPNKCTSSKVSILLGSSV